jgi:hypothetical protein
LTPCLLDLCCDKFGQCTECGPQFC